MVGNSVSCTAVRAKFSTTAKKTFHIQMFRISNFGLSEKTAALTMSYVINWHPIPHVSWHQASVALSLFCPLCLCKERLTFPVCAKGLVK